VSKSRTQKNLHPFDKRAYSQTNLIERMFSHLDDFRRVATRSNKLSVTYDAAVLIAAMVILAVKSLGPRVL
jgi:transposase